MLLVASHADIRMCFKNAVGEFSSKDAEHVLGRMLDDFGNVFDIHPRVFVLDANVSNSQDMKALKHAISELKSEIIDVSQEFFFSFSRNFKSLFLGLTHSLHLDSIAPFPSL